jgi:hypothetical protein
MDLRKRAKEIYAESLLLNDRGKGSYYRRAAIKEAPREDQYFLRTYIAQIGRQRLSSVAKTNRLFYGGDK